MNAYSQPQSKSIARSADFHFVMDSADHDSPPVTDFSFADPLIKHCIYGFGAISLLFVISLGTAYLHFARVIEKRMTKGVFKNAARIYSRPLLLKVGDEINEQTLIAHLRCAGYCDELKEDRSLVGSYSAFENAVSVKAGPEAQANQGNAIVHFNGDRISGISAPDGTAYPKASTLQPPLITALPESQDRAKRQLVTFDQIPKDLVNAVVAIEDRRFFSHSGINIWRLLQAAVIDVLHLQRSQGGSTLTMQLSRGFFLSPEKTLQRKAAEVLLAIGMERRYSKQRIFEMYANYVPMGQLGTFSVNGFGEASHVYFNKDISKLTLPEAALLAAILQRPSYLSPFRYPERAIKRRNLVLDSMAAMGSISLDQATEAKATPLQLNAGNPGEDDAPYFVDMVRDQLAKTYSESDLTTQAFRVYSTLDLDLQHTTREAVDEGRRSVDNQLAKQRGRSAKNQTESNASFEDKTTQSGAKSLPQVACVSRP